MMSYAVRGMYTARVTSNILLQNGIRTRSFADAPAAVTHKFEKSINQVTLLGRCGNLPELRGTAEYPVVQFSLATHMTFYKGGEPQQNTVWHRVSIFKPGLRDLILNHVTKGARVFVQGRIGYYEKRDPDTDLVMNKTASIVADDVVFFNKESSSEETSKE